MWEEIRGKTSEQTAAQRFATAQKANELLDYNIELSTIYRQQFIP